MVLWLGGISSELHSGTLTERTCSANPKDETNALESECNKRHVFPPSQRQNGPGHESRNLGHRVQRAHRGPCLSGDEHVAGQHRITVPRGARIASVRTACRVCGRTWGTRVQWSDLSLSRMNMPISRANLLPAFLCVASSIPAKRVANPCLTAS